jgi:hypothetical protein
MKTQSKDNEAGLRADAGQDGAVMSRILAAIGPVLFALGLDSRGVEP